MKRITKDFSWVSWDEQKINEVVESIIQRRVRSYADIKAVPSEQRTFENTVYALDCARRQTGDDINCIDFLMYVSPSDSIRTAAKNAIDVLESRLIDIEYDEGLYAALKEYAAEGKNDSGQDAKLLRDMLRGYRRMGFDLPKEVRDQAKENMKRQAQLGTEFSKNINDWHDHIELKKKETDGLPESYLKTLKNTPAGDYIISLEYPELFPFLDKAKNSDRRRELSEKALQKGGARNMEILEELITLRDQYARLLGYQNHASYRTETRMAKNAATVQSFLEDLAARLGEVVKKDVARMQEAKDEEMEKEGKEKEPLAHYDIRYYMDMLEKKSFDFDSEKLREFFPLQKVVAGTFTIYQKLLGVVFEKISDPALWHPDVELYAIKDKGEIIAHFALDLYPREGKYGHAAAFNIIKGRKRSFAPTTDYIAPFSAMVTNFRKPAADTPSLLSHDEVRTFFHEFGHVVHQTLTTATYYSQSGTSVTRDFVEAPSQMLENWIWDAQMLKLLSGHYQHPDQKIPDEVIENLRRSRDHMIGYLTMRQVALSLFDFTIHQKLLSKDEIAKVYNDINRQLLTIALPADSIFPAGFGHLVGYDAGYYGYLWSKVYAADMFTRFAAGGLMDPALGASYRAQILEVGSSREELDSVVAFLGRAPNNEAFLKQIGL